MLNRYQIVRKLDHGGFGTVYLAIDSTTSNRVAVKFLRCLAPDARERFEREVRLLYSQIYNRFVVTLIDFNLSCEQPYIVMEFCELGSLRALVQSPKSWSRVARIVSHVAEGLHGIHAAGGFHRDIKPENLLVARDQASNRLIVKLADFGLARIPMATSSSMTRSPAGTTGYIAPEVLAGKPFSSSADIYSLGVVVTELLTGSRDVRRLGTVEAPSELRQLVLAMVRENPAARPSAATVVAMLQRLLRDSSAISTVGQTQEHSHAGNDVLKALAVGAVIGTLLALGGNRR